MKGKIFTIVLTTIMAFVFTFGLSACGGHKHELGELKIVKSPNCTEEGEGIRICKTCGEEISEVIAPLGHDLQSISGKAPTCEDDGYSEYEVCLHGCGYNTKAEHIIPATGEHVYDDNGFCIYCKREKTKLNFKKSEDETYAVFVSIIGGDGDEFEIPSEFEGLPVKEIGEYAFSESIVTKVTIPDSVTTIGAHAFGGSDVTEVKIPDSVTEIGEYAFSGCAITEVKIPGGVKEIAAYSFSDSALTSVTISYGVETIGIFAFEGTLITKIVIPDSVTEIREEAFGDCENLTTVTLSDNIEKLDGAFNHCENIIYNKGAETNRGNYLGSKNNPLLVLMNSDRDVESFEIDKDTKIILSGAFMGCTKLREIEIPDTVRSLGDSLFATEMHMDSDDVACESLESVTFPASLEKIPGSMFQGCSNLTDIKYFDVVKQEKVDGLPDGLKEIGDSAFANSGIENIVIPLSVTKIDYSAFEGSALKEVTFESSINSSCRSIGFNAFAYCSQLENIVLPDSLTEIDNNMFEYCEKLEWVYVPAAVKIIGDYAFNGCNNLKYVYYGGTTQANWKDVTLKQFIWGDKDIGSIVYLHYGPDYVPGGRYWDWNYDGDGNPHVVYPS